MNRILGSIEAGGTKFVCAIGNQNLEILERVSFPTTTPEETMKLVIDFFKIYQEDLGSIGIGSFGPIDIHPDSPTYGYITSTPKQAWQDFDFVGSLKNTFENMPVAWTTDVNAACYGEYIAGSGRDLNSVVYFTIGTGVGGGALQNGVFVEGFSHPEMGHMQVQRHPDDSFEGTCVFHGNCLEGVAAGPAIEKRTGEKGQNLKADDPLWDIEAFYIAQCIYNTTLILSPNVIIIGGGVMQQGLLLNKVRKAFTALMKGYVKTPAVDKYIVIPKLGDNAGTVGCLALARETLLPLK